MMSEHLTSSSDLKRSVSGHATPSVTVCVCTRNRNHYVSTCLDSLRSQTVGLDAFSVIVVDSDSSAETAAGLRDMVATLRNARLLRIHQPGLSLARNTAVRSASGDYVAFIDDDAIAAPDWIEQIQRAASEQQPPPAVLSGRTLPIWEAPLPDWWPQSLRGVLTITEWEGSGEYRTPEVPAHIGPYGVNLVLERKALLAIGGFAESLGRDGDRLLSDEDVHVAWMLQDSGRSARHDARIVVSHHIQAARLTPVWLLQRQYWQGVSTVVTRRMLHQSADIWREFPRRLAVTLLFAPAALIPRSSIHLMGLRWRHAYASGYVRAVLGRLGMGRVTDAVPIGRTA